MAAIEELSTLRKEKDTHSPTGSVAEEEKTSMKDVRLGHEIVDEKEMAQFNPGDVYENVRAIDLGDDGKERAIGELLR